MADKPTSKAEQVAALRQARAERSKGSPELEAAFAVLLPKAESSDGGVESRHANQVNENRCGEMTGVAQSGRAPVRHAEVGGSNPSTRRAKSGSVRVDEKVKRGVDPTPIVTAAGVAPGPSEAKSKRGRPRIGEVREKPWLTADPPMSERTWYRRQREQGK